MSQRTSTICFRHRKTHSINTAALPLGASHPCLNRRFMKTLDHLTADPRVTVRRPGAPDPKGRCVVYWMQRAQRALDNPALDVAVEAANILKQPVVIFFAPVPFYPHANLRHYAFLAQGIPDTAERARKRGIGFVLRRYP